MGWVSDFAFHYQDLIQLVLVIGVVFTSVWAIIISKRQSEWQKKHDQQSVKPFLILEYESLFNENKEYVFILKIINAGLGPAIIENCSLQNDNKEIEFKDLTKVCFSQLRYFNSSYYRFDTGEHAIPVKDEITLFIFKSQPFRNTAEVNKINKFVSDKLYKNFIPLKLDIKYRSFHNEETFSLTRTGDEIYGH